MRPINKKNIRLVSTLLIFGIFLTLNSCSNTSKKSDKKEDRETVYASDIIPFFNHWNLILGDGSNAGEAINFENKDFFYTVSDEKKNWVVYKAPNAGDTHGTSNNCRTELAQLKKWYPATANDKLTATLKVMNVSTTGDARVAASYSVVVGQIHSADGHENEPLKIFYKKFPGHTKGSVFWHYEINTSGDDNSGRWDYSTAVWGNDFSVVGADANTYPEEPKGGIVLGEEFSYEIEVKNGIMHLKFMSEGHETRTFTKNLIVSEYTTTDDIPKQTQDLFVPIGQDGVERETAYAGEGLFFKLGSYNQTNGKSPEVNRNWCSGAETHGGDVKKQYADGNYAEVWFKKASIYVSKTSVSNKGYFTKNNIMKNKLIGKNVLITAGAQGIGESITKHFIDSGANVAIHYFSSADVANQLTKYATSKGLKAVAISGDLTKEGDANIVAEKTVEVLGGLDILINNAGSLVARKLLNEMEAEFWHRVMDINLTSMMFVTRATSPYLAKNNNSSIVNLASLAGRKGGHPGSLAYATSKGAILTFTRALATELGPQSTRVNAVAPGLILGTSFHNTHTTKESAEATTASIPIKRAGNADDVARAVLYLASEYDGFITGATLDINGGVYNM